METILRRDYHHVLKKDNRFPLLSSIVLLISTLVILVFPVWSPVFWEVAVQIILYVGLGIHVFTRIVCWLWPYVEEVLDNLQ